MATAAFDQSPKGPCLSGTRVKIPQELVSEVKDDRTRVVWLKGSPGKGKSTIAKSLCIELRADKIPVFSFFFNKDGGKAHTASTEIFASTIARQLARFSPDFNDALAALDLEQIVRIISKEEQLQQLVVTPARKIKWPFRAVLVLDALDECGDRRALEELMELVRKLLQLPPAFAIFISCRPVDIVDRFLGDASAKHHSLDGSGDAEDIRLFVETSLLNIPDHSESGKWPPQCGRMDEFADACGGLFEIASVRVRRVRDEDILSRIEIFDHILSDRDPAPSLVKEYRRILKSAYTAKLVSDEKTRSREVAYKRYRLLVGVLITTEEPMTPRSLSSLVNMEVYKIRDSLRQLSPIMEIRGDDDPFRFYHASSREFLLSDDKDPDPAFRSYPISFNGAQHIEMLEHCLKNFEASDYGKNRWRVHLWAIKAEEAPRAVAALKLFLEEGLMKWLEFMSSRVADGQYFFFMHPRLFNCSRNSTEALKAAFTWLIFQEQDNTPYVTTSRRCP